MHKTLSGSVWVCVCVCRCVYVCFESDCVFVCGTGPQFFFVFFCKFMRKAAGVWDFKLKSGAWSLIKALIVLSSPHSTARTDTGSDQMMDRKRTFGTFRYVLLINFIECCKDTFYVNEMKFEWNSTSMLPCMPCAHAHEHARAHARARAG